jgi:hypothetical protein
MAIKNPLTMLRYDPRQEYRTRRGFLRKTAIPKLEMVGVINNLKELIRYVEGLPSDYLKMRQAMENDLDFLKALSRSQELDQKKNLENSLTWLGYHPSQDKVVRQEFIIKTAIPKLTKVQVVNCLNQLIRSVESLPYAHRRHELIQEMKRDLNLVVTQRISRDRDIKLSKKTVQRRSARTRNKKSQKKRIIDIDIPKDTKRGDWRGRG